MNYSAPIIDGYNEIVGPTNNLPLDDIQAHPENYLDYEYEEATDDPGEKALEAENAAEDARGVIEQITKDSYLHTALQSFIDTVTATPTAYGNAVVKKIEGFTRQETTTGAQLFDVNSTVTANQATKAILNDGRDLQVTGKKLIHLNGNILSQKNKIGFGFSF